MDYSGNCQTLFSGDDLFVDELLDLSNAFSDGYEGDYNPCSILSLKKPENNEGDKQAVTNMSPVKQDFTSLTLLGSQLSLSGDDLDNLEWLSHFVEDSFSEYSLAHFPANLPEKPLMSTFQEKPYFIGPVQTKTSTQIWLLEPTSSSVENKPTGRRPKKKMEKGAKGIGGKQCSHCRVQKTPLWRTGSLGEKTLCNVCGVWFKSDRFLPEYWPARSPTFSTGLHSNSHRKVLEMRQKKETESDRLVHSF